MAGGRGFYNAAATYTGTASSKYATGYTVTADYAGEVTKTTSGTVLYTAVFGLAEEQEAVTAIPQPAAEGGGFDWRWLLVLPAGAGVTVNGVVGTVSDRYEATT